jgi:hypothetical protein
MSQITQTVLEVQSTGQEFPIPGDFTVDQVVSAYSGNIPGLANMQAQVHEEGGVRTITFSPRTGTKG